MTIYDQHRCSRHHRTYRAFANCVWPKTAWISGEGQYAVLAPCGALTISLYHRLDQAEEDQALIDLTGCGGLCHGDHEIVQLVLP